MNFTIQTPDERLASVSKPVLEPLKELKLASQDWFVVCAGFEERTLAILENAVSAQGSFNILIINYRPLFPENRLEAIREVCRRAQLVTKEVVYNREDPTGFGQIILNELADAAGRVFVDISAMSRLLIVQVLVALGTREIGFTNCFVVYAEAQNYPPNREQAEAELVKSKADPTFSILFLSSGVFEITVLPELSSPAATGGQTRLVAFPSLDAHQLTALRAEVQPSRFSFIEGAPPHSENKWRERVIAQLNNLDEIRDCERVSTSTLDYRETLNALLLLYARHSVRDRLLISPTGSKMQTVAVGIFRSMVGDVQIVYPTPRGFKKPDSYTLGIGPLYLLPLNIFATAGKTDGFSA
jgi:hypothetical protein